MLTVLMPVFNTEPYTTEAIESVLAQTFRDFELLIIDDGSIDGTPEVLKRFAARDSRIRVITQKNLGLAHALNRGLESATTEWVAIMHGDDVMQPHRLRRQLAFTAEHPTLAVAGSLVHFTDAAGRTLGLNRSHLTTRQAVREAVARNERVAFNHPAVMLRREIVLSAGGYRQEFWPAEDVELWNRLLARGHEVLVQPESLLKYRIHCKSASATRARLVVRKLRWIEVRMADLRAGRPESTWEEFEGKLRSLPLMAKLNEWRHDCGRTWYQLAQQNLGMRRFLMALPLLAASVILEPVFASRLLSRCLSIFACSTERTVAEREPTPVKLL